MILHLYFARRFAVTFAGILAGFIAFLWLVELLEHVRRYGDENLGIGGLAYLALLHLPGILYEILSLIVLLATVAMFISLARTSELVITRSSGRSAMNSLAAPFVTALLIGAVAVAVLNPLVASMSRKYESKINAVNGENSVVSISREGLWLRQGQPDRQTAIRAQRANLDGTQLYDVTFFGFSVGGTPIYRIDAAEATLTEGAWKLTQAKRWLLEDTENPEAEAETLDNLLVPSDLTRNQIRDSFGTPSSIPIWQLPNFISQLETAGFSARAHRVRLQSEFARPFTFAAMVLLGAVFTLRHTRMGRTGTMVFLAVLSGFGLYFAASLTTLMGESGQLPVPLAVWGAPAVAVCLALSALLHLEDG